MIQFFVLICAIVCSAIFYRAGGQSRDKNANPKWMPMWLRKSWVRDWLCPLVFLLCVFSFWRPSSLLDWGMLLPYYILSGFSLSTYWDWTNKGEANFYVYGLFCGIAGFALLTFVPWWILTLRLIICTVGMGVWSKYQDNDVTEEFGRGIFFIL